MNNKKIILIIMLISVLMIVGCNTTAKVTYESSPNPITIDKLEIIHFHATNQCYSCITVGNYAEETVNTYFKDELESGIITFNHINGELLENRELVIKYGATGSSLWLGVYNNESFIAEQNVNVWYRINNKESYMDYLKGVIEQKLAGN